MLAAEGSPGRFVSAAQAEVLDRYVRDLEAERDELRARVDELEVEVAGLHGRLGAVVAAAPEPPAASADELADRLVERLSGTFARKSGRKPKQAGSA
jgi:hypothetical protein